MTRQMRRAMRQGPLVPLALVERLESFLSSLHSFSQSSRLLHVQQPFHVLMRDNLI